MSKIEAEGPDGKFSPEQCRELGESVEQIMREYAATSLPGFDVASASLKFYLGDSAGDIVGHWEVTVTRSSLD